MLQSVIQQSLGTNSVIGESLTSHIAGPTSPTPSIDSDSLSGGINVAGSASSAVRTSILNGSGTGNISYDTNSDNVSNGSRSESSGLGSIGTSTIIGSGRPLSDGGNGELGRPNVGRSASSSSTASSSSSGLGSSPLGCRASSASSLFTSTTVAGSNGLSGGLVQLPGSSGGSPTGIVKCWHCCNNFDRPKVLHGCFHTFCEPCLEKIQDHPEKITCPQCNTETMLGNAGISGLLSDYGIFGMESSTLNGEQHVHSNICTSCKTRESTAVARCLTCSNFLCPNCVTAHQFMHCFDGHHVTTLGELVNKDNCPQEIQQLNSISHVMQEGRSKASDLKSNLKNLEAASVNLSQHFNNSRSDVNDAFQYYVSILEERKNDVIRELEGHYSRKQVALSLYSQKAHETIDKIYQVTAFIERLMRYSRNAEVLMFKHPLEQQFSTLSNNMNAIENIGSLSPENVCDFEFISNYQAIQNGVRNTFGYLNSRNSPNTSSATQTITQNSIQNGASQLNGSMGGCNAAVGGPTSKQPPISRPTSISASSGFNCPNDSTQGSNEPGLILSSLIGNVSNSGNSSSDNSSSLSNGWAQGLANLTTLSSNNPSSVSSMLNGAQQNHSHQNHMHSSSGSSNRSNTNNGNINGAGNQLQGNSANLLANGINGIHINSVNNDGISPHLALKSVMQLENQRHSNHFGSPSSPLPSSLNQSISHHQQHNSSFNTHNSAVSMCQNPNSQQLSTNGNAFENGLLSKRLNGGATLGSLLNGVTSDYEKWSNGSNSVDHSSVASTSKMHLFGNGDNVAAAVAAYGASLNSGSNSGASNSIHPNAVNNDNGRGLTGNSVNGQSQLNSVTSSNNATAESIMELSTKMLQVQQQQFNSSQNSQTSLSTNGSSTSSMFPPKSQIKRQKMIYHCKFGEFGVLEGQFTEPSGVAVNAQNDIIVADTNNHRIQIFDKEGRFKFQFGECGKRDGQLLYPNRVAAVRASGDIIVTERSPTHQVQIYNQYGQFVRKFGANILQHPRGVCVDNKGRIIVVECKVMRVIIFDQMGNVLNKFGCSKHLEFPNGVVVNDRQEIFISDNRAHCVKVFNYEGTYLRQIGGEGLTNYPIGVGINGAGEVTIADNHNNFNLSVFSQEGQLLSALESKVKHAQCFDVALMDDGSVVLASKDYRLYIYRYVQLPPMGMLN